MNVHSQKFRPVLVLAFLYLNLFHKDNLKTSLRLIEVEFVGVNNL